MDQTQQTSDEASSFPAPEQQTDQEFLVPGPVLPAESGAAVEESSAAEPAEPELGPTGRP